MYVSSYYMYPHCMIAFGWKIDGNLMYMYVECKQNQRKVYQSRCEMLREILSDEKFKTIDFD